MLCRPLSVVLVKQMCILSWHALGNKVWHIHVDTHHIHLDHLPGSSWMFTFLLVFLLFLSTISLSTYPSLSCRAKRHFLLHCGERDPRIELWQQGKKGGYAPQSSSLPPHLLFLVLQSVSPSVYYMLMTNIL